MFCCSQLIIPVDANEESYMSKNVGGIDRILRIVVGLGLLSLVFIGPQTPFGWIGLVPLLTAAIGWCPAYTIFGIKTCPAQKA
jgi:hypothetical protein